MIYRMKYLRDGYILADAFRPDPGWGARVFNANASDFPWNGTDEEIITIAQSAAPAGFWLQTLERIGGDPHVHVMFKKAVPGAIRAAEAAQGGEHE